MELTDAGLKGITGEFGHVERVMEQVGFARGGAWDYNKASFDLKLEGKDSDYYLRVQSHVVKGVLEDPKATIELENPVFLRHIFPHGLDGNTEIPEELENTIQETIQHIKKELG
ncbi:YugN family protein [Desmospora profundinema]|uniref:YugN-like family protein n=1 Tax=Desmospora profundinema TaxID=1571184 RepID=A0ABU1IKJ3_9BACL|nr:YugN family protein [Desmospora profundinema]MDR6225305.1 hypothetical protein [Desmospora profundinema]